MKEDQVEDFSYLLYNPKNPQVRRGMVECDINYNTCMTVAIYIHITANTWVTSTTFLGCFSCTSVTKECYQVGFLEGSLRSFFISYVSSSLFSEELFGYIPGIPTTTMQPRNSSRSKCVRS